REREPGPVVVANAILVVILDDGEQEWLRLAAPARFQADLAEQQANRRRARLVGVRRELGLRLRETPAPPERLGPEHERAIRERRVGRPQRPRLGERLVVPTREQEELGERKARRRARRPRERSTEVAFGFVVATLGERFPPAREPRLGRLFLRAHRRCFGRDQRTRRAPARDARQRQAPGDAETGRHGAPRTTRTGSPRPTPSRAAALAFCTAISTSPKEPTSATHSSSPSAYVPTDRRRASRISTVTPSPSSTLAGRFVIKLPNRSTAMTSPNASPFSTRGARRACSVGACSGPTSERRSAPEARRPATGANTSRPWKVRLATERRRAPASIQRTSQLGS